MNFFRILPFIGAGFSVGLAVLAILQDRRSFVHRIFAGGMVLLALDAVTIGIGLRTFLSSEITNWQNIRLMITSFLPGVWLLFALTYARVNYRRMLLRWRWIILAAFVVPLILSVFFRKSFFIGEPVWDSSLGWLIRLGKPGYGFHLCLLVSAILILMNLERTFRASIGHIRWQIKYMVLGIGAICGVWVYTAGQTILFQSLDTGLLLVNAGALVIADALILRSVLRVGSFKLDFYPSHSFLYNSFIVFIAGIYLLAVGVLIELIQYLHRGTSLYLTTFSVFLALLGLPIILLSDRLRHKMRRFIAIHLKRPQFDYQKEWMRFTEKTSTITDVKDLCMTVSGMISNILEVLSVTIWLLDESRSRLRPVGSTVFSETGIGHRISEEAAGKLLGAIRDEEMPLGLPVDLDNVKVPWAHDLKQSMPDSIREARVRYWVPLSAGKDLLGVITLGDKVEYASFSFEEMDLLKTIADQTAARLLNLKLSEDLRKAKEMETVQTMSSFFVHDLKNLASGISLTIQNLPLHFDSPQFRNDTLTLMKQSVNKINSMCSDLSLLGKRIELRKCETDLNELIMNSLSCLNGCAKVRFIQDLQPVAKLMIDPEQLQKVLTNLILNANEAVEQEGEIRLATEQRDGWATVSVKDSGCGMSKKFMEESLFRPFKTTKKQGMGIGLFQSKMIVEAHQGRIEVESELGKGSTFRVFLPLAGE
jgi:putative PEP-CTERM system histidine kinase